MKRINEPKTCLLHDVHTRVVVLTINMYKSVLEKRMEQEKSGNLSDDPKRMNKYYVQRYLSTVLVLCIENIN